MIYAILVPLSVVLSNVANLLTQIIVPRFLPPTEYTKFVVLWGVGQVLAAFLFEWLRFGTLRFAIGADSSLTRLRRHALKRGYVVIGLMGLSASIVLFAAAGVWPEALIGGLVSGYAVSQGLFDALQALSRAERSNKYFSFASILRSVLGLGMAVWVARSVEQGYYVFFSIAFSYLLAALCVYLSRLKMLFAPVDYSQEQMRFLAKFGVFAALSSITSTALPALVRMLAAEFVGLADSAGVLLALDLSQKVASVVGLAVNMLVMQKAFRSAEFGDAQSQGRRLSMQMASTTAFVVPAALGFYLLQPFIFQYLVPDSYARVYLDCIKEACLAAALLGFRQFGVDPLFLTIKRAGVSVVGPLVSVLGVVCWVYVFHSLSSEARLISEGLVFGLTCGVLTSVFLLCRVADFEWPIRDLLFVLVGCLVMWIVVHACEGLAGWKGGVLGACLGGMAYLCVILVFDVCGLRKEFLRVLFDKKILG